MINFEESQNLSNFSLVIFFPNILGSLPVTNENKIDAKS